MNGWCPRPPARPGWYVGVGEDDEDIGAQISQVMGDIPMTPEIERARRRNAPDLNVQPPVPPERVTENLPVDPHTGEQLHNPTNEEELRARIARSDINPLQRLGQIGQGLQHNWLIGGAQAAFAPLEPVLTGAHYAAGALEGAQQWAAEHYTPQIANLIPSATARNAIAREVSGDAQTQDQEGIGGMARRALGVIGVAPAIPALALAGAAKIGADIATGNVPEAPGWTQGPEGFNTSDLVGNQGWVPPARNLQEIVDPSYALARQAGNAPGVTGAALDMLAMGGMSPTMGLGKLAVAPAMRALGAPAGIARVAEMTPSEMAARGLTELGERGYAGLNRLTGATGPAGWNDIQTVTSTPLTRALNRAGDFLNNKPTVPIATLAGEALGGVKGILDTQDETNPVEAAKTVGLDLALGALAGYHVGLGTRALGGAASQFSRLDPRVTEDMLDLPTTAPLAKAAQDARVDSLRKVAETGTTESFPYPGGAGRQWLASVRTMLTDRYAFLEDWVAWDVASNGARFNVAEDPYSLARTAAAVDAKVSMNVHKQLGGMLMNGAGMTRKQIPKFFEYVNAVVQDDWAKDGYYFLNPKVINTPEKARQNLWETRAAVNALGPVDQGGVKVGRSVAWDGLARSITEDVYNPRLKDLEALGKLAPGKADEIINARQVYTAIDDLGFTDSSVRHIIGSRTGVAAQGQPAGFANSTTGVGAGDFATNVQRLTRLDTMIERQKVMNGLVEMSEQSPDFGKYLVYEGRAVQHRKIRDESLEGKGIQKDLYGPMGAPGTPGVPGTAKAGATSNEGLMDVKRRFLGDEPMYLREAAESIEVPKGWQVIPHWKDGEAHLYRAPEGFADSIMGWNRYDADIFSTALGKWTSAPLFRKGVTMWSLPFVINNVFRDAQSVAQNVNAGALKEYHAGLFEAVTKSIGLTDFFERHAVNPMIETFPERVAVALEPAFKALEKRVLGVDPITGEAKRALPEFFENLGGQSSFYETATHAADPEKALNLPSGETTRGVMSPLAPIGYLGEAAAGAMNPVNWFKAAAHTMETVSQATELAPRLGVYRWGTGIDEATGLPRMSQRAAAYLGRNATVDFSKAGYVGATLNKFLPLFNPRTQGELRNVQAMYEDPKRWQATAMATSGLPTIALWTMNQRILGDAYNTIPQKTLDNNFIIGLGKYTDPEGNTHAIYIPVRKDPTAAILSTPLEYFLDTQYRTRQGELPLAEHQRSRRSASQVFLDDLSNLIPVNVNNDEVANPLAWGMGVATMNPTINTLVGLASNTDPFTQRPLDPAATKDLPWEYHADNRTPKAIRALSLMLKRSNIPIPDKLGESLLAPSRLDFVTRSQGGTAAQTVIGWAGNAALGKLMEAGVISPDALRPTTWEDLRMPPSTSPVRQEQLKYALDQMDSQDNRPFWTKLPAIIRISGGAQPYREIIDRADSITQKQYYQTHDANAQYRTTADQINRDMADFWTSREILNQTSQQVRDKLHDWSQQKAGARTTAFSGEGRDFAIQDPAQLQDALGNLPGMPVNPWRDSLPRLPEGVTAETIRSRVDASVTPGASAYQQGVEKHRTIAQIADDYHLPMDVVNSHLAAQVLGKDVPALDIPNLWLEKVVGDYLDPPLHEGEKASGITPRDMANRRRQVLEQYAQAGRTTVDSLRGVIQLRLLGSTELNPLQDSYIRALDVAQDLHDPTKYPDFATRDGRPLGNPDDWEYQRNMVGYWRQSRTPRAAWPATVQALDTAMRYGEIHRIEGAIANEQWIHYDRWFGAGANTPLGEWETFMSGKVPKYRTGTPPDWLKRDEFMRIYNLLPPGSQEKNALSGTYQQFKRELTPGWKQILHLDELEREGVVPPRLDETSRQNIR
jgi:hypothetical protein